MNTKASKPKKTSVTVSDVNSVSSKAADLAESPALKSEVVSSEELLKARKKHHAKVVRDSFSFPEVDYLKILQIKAVCLAEGIHVKKGEVLRAGLQLLMQLSLDDLKQAIGNVDRVKTGRPVSKKL